MTLLTVPPLATSAPCRRTRTTGPCSLSTTDGVEVKDLGGVLEVGHLDGLGQGVIVIWLQTKARQWWRSVPDPVGFLDASIMQRSKCMLKFEGLQLFDPMKKLGPDYGKTLLGLDLFTSLGIKISTRRSSSSRTSSSTGRTTLPPTSKSSMMSPVP